MKLPVSARIETRQGRPTLLINDEPATPLLYGTTQTPGGRFTWEEIPARNIRIFGKSGFRLFQPDIWMRDMICADGSLDVSLARRQIAGVRAACPEGLVMFRLHLNPPASWCEANRDECVGYADVAEPARHESWGVENPITPREQNHPLRASFYSKKWLEWCRRYINEFAQKLSATPEGGALFAVQIAYGVQGEWHQFAFFWNDPDTGVAATNAYRDWLRVRYETDAALASAWSRTQQPGATLADARTPTSPERAAVRTGILRDPQRDRATIDYFTFLHDAQADAMIELAKMVKAAWPRPIVTVAFYGYFYCMFGRDAAGGHLAMERVFASPHIDALGMTPSYRPTTRSMGGPGNGRGIMAAARRFGKLVFDEMDQPTTVTNNCPWEKWNNTSIDDDIAILRRNIMQPVTRGGAAWWYDFGMIVGTPDFERVGNIGWWDHPRLQDEVARLHALVAGRIGKPYTRPADILLVQDPRSFLHVASEPHKPVPFGIMPVSAIDPLTPLVTDGLFEALQRTGAIFDDAFLSEIGALDFTPYRLVIFATASILTAEQREIIRTRVARDGRHIVFVGAAGWSDGQADFGPQNISKLLGVKITARTIPAATSEIRIDGAHETVDLKRAFESTVYEPAPNAASQAASDCEIIARWPDGSASAIARTDRTANATWWAFALPPCTAPTLRALAKRARCHIVNEHDDVTLLGDNFLVVHTMTGGTRTLALPITTSSGDKKIAVTLPPHSTTIFDATTGEILMQ